MILARTPSNLPQNYQRHELVLIDFLFQPAQISSLLYGSTFQQSLLEAMTVQFYSADEKLKYGLLALASSISVAKKIEGFVSATFGQDNSSKALTLYSKSAVGNLEDARATLALALSLVTHNDLSLGLPTLPIARSALLRVRPWKEFLIGRTTDDTDPCIVCVLFVEVFECLMTGEIPVFRYDAATDNDFIDRYYGICHELLGCFYDICVLYKLLRAGGFGDRSSYAQRILHTVQSWDPSIVLAQRGLSLTFDEYYHCLSQAKCFKLAVQLLISQSERTTPADSLSKALATELEDEIQQTMIKGKGRPKYLLFPFFVASVELGNCTPGASAAVKQNMAEISNHMAPKACEAMLRCLQDIWEARQRYPDLLWFQCISDDQVITMGP
jgi:hypothetical protein